MVHGLGVASSYMIPLAQRLASQFRVYIPEFPGFGESSKPEKVLDVTSMAASLLEWMDIVGVAQPALFGNSLGCQIIVRAIEMQPDVAACAILQGPTVDREARTIRQQVFRLLRDAPHERTAMLGVAIRDYHKAGPWRMLQTLRYALADDVENAVPHVETPVMVLRGTRDPVAPDRWTRELARRLPHSVHRTIECGPHAVHFTMPDEVAAVILPFFEWHLMRTKAEPRRAGLDSR